MLEAGLRRGEARLHHLRVRDERRAGCGEAVVGNAEEEIMDAEELMDVGDGEDGNEVIVSSREEGERLWNEVCTARFLRGADEDFAYEAVDADSALDVEERRDAEERWYDDESEGAVGVDGETGVQDF